MEFLGGRYDMHLVLERAQRRPELKPNPRLIGLKMYTLELQGTKQRHIVFKDTFHFFMCALSTLPKTFGLHVQDKGFFPIYLPSVRILNNYL